MIIPIAMQIPVSREWREDAHFAATQNVACCLQRPERVAGIQKSFRVNMKLDELVRCGEVSWFVLDKGDGSSVALLDRQIGPLQRLSDRIRICEILDRRMDQTLTSRIGVLDQAERQLTVGPREGPKQKCQPGFKVEDGILGVDSVISFALERDGREVDFELQLEDESTRRRNERASTGPVLRQSKTQEELQADLAASSVEVLNSGEVRIHYIGSKNNILRGLKEAVELIDRVMAFTAAEMEGKARSLSGKYSRNPVSHSMSLPVEQCSFGDLAADLQDRLMDCFRSSFKVERVADRQEAENSLAGCEMRVSLCQSVMVSRRLHGDLSI